MTHSGSIKKVTFCPVLSSSASIEFHFKTVYPPSLFTALQSFAQTSLLSFEPDCSKFQQLPNYNPSLVSAHSQQFDLMTGRVSLMSNPQTHESCAKLVEFLQQFLQGQAEIKGQWTCGDCKHSFGLLERFVHVAECRVHMDNPAIALARALPGHD